MCCGGYGSNLDPGAYVIAELKKGDEIFILDGFGHPKVTKAEHKIIFETDQYSAICTDGTILNCYDGRGLTKSGRNLPAKPSIKVFIVKGKIFLRRLWSPVADFFFHLNNQVWFFKFRLKKKLEKIIH